MDLIDQILLDIQPEERSLNRPWVTLSYAQSVDGCISLIRGKPIKLSGPASNILTHHLRAHHDAILVGVDTVLADDPQLTVRLVPGDQPQPVILDSRLRIPTSANLLQGRAQLDLPLPWIATTHPSNPLTARALQESGARLLQFDPAPDSRIPLPDLLERLAALGIRSLMVEGGARVITSFLSARLVDSLVITIAPVFLGGLHAVEHLGVNGNAHPRPELVNTHRLGEDLILWGKF